MGRFVAARAGQAVLVLIGITIAATLLIHAAPGDPAQTILGSKATPDALAQLRADLGLDQSIFAQYATFVGHLVSLDFGESFIQRVSVAELIGPNLGATLILTIYASLVSLLIGLPLGVLSALRKNASADHVIRTTTMVTFAMPPFWLGLLLILVFGVWLGVLPTSGYGEGFLEHIKYSTLPAITLGLGIAPLLVRSLRGSLVETLDSEFVEAATARGLGRRRVVWKYAVRNSLVATITVLGVNIGILIGGVVVVENVFDLPGLGTLLVQSVNNRDFPVVQALVVIFGAAVVMVNFLTDMAYALVDPRVRL